MMVMDTLKELIQGGLVKQVGVIVFGDGQNVAHLIERAQKDGYYVYNRGHFAELYL